MKRLIKFLALLALTMIVFAVTSWLLAPWTQAGIYALDVARLHAANNECYATYRAIEANGRITPIYSIRDLDVERSPYARISFSNVRIKPLPLSSLLAGTATCFIEFDGAEMTAPMNIKLNIGNGSARIAASDSEITATHVIVSGDIRITGGITFDMPGGRIKNSTLAMRVPDSLNSIISSPMAAQIIGQYLESENHGEWRLKYDASPNR
ncbi:MAG: hypothetical protein LBT08_02790 [Synergistaceae bacterium]|nr:hypothetical protein [Synergistaceae bacterium]